MRRALVVLGVVVLAACQDQAPSHRTPPMASVGLQSINPYFQWQSPVPPGNPAGDGVFYGTLAPRVTICQVSGGGCSGINWSADGAEPASSAIAVANLTTEVYQVNWASAHSHDRGSYTISVDVDGKVLGEVTVQLTSGGGGNDPLAFGGNSVPIKFRIEVGALCWEEDNCAEAPIGPDGGVVILDTDNEFTGTGGLKVPPGAVNEYVVFHMRRYFGPQACLPLDAPNARLDGSPLPAGVRYIQYEGCYILRTTPEIQRFAQAVEIGMCLDQYAANGGERIDQLVAIKGREIEGATPEDTIIDPTSLVTLEGAPDADWMECVEPEEIALLDGAAVPAQRLAGARRLLAPLARLFSPAPLHARRRGSIPPYTKLATEFSRAAPVRPVTVTFENVDVSGLPNTLLQSQPTVIVHSAVPGVAEVGVRGVPVSLVASGTSTVSSPMWTDASGRAVADWALGGVGSYTLDATVGYFWPGSNGNTYGGFPNVAAPLATKRFQATAATHQAYFMSPLGDGSTSPGNLTTVTTQVFVCGPLAAVGAACTGNGSSQAQLDAPKLDRSGAFWATAWKPGKNVPNGLYRIEVRLGGAVIGKHYGRRGGGGGTDENGVRQFNSDSNVPVKYSVWQ